MSNLTPTPGIPDHFHQPAVVVNRPDAAPDREIMMFKVSEEVHRVYDQIPDNNAFKQPLVSLMHPQQPEGAQEFLALRESQMADVNAIAKSFRGWGVQNGQRVPNTRAAMFPKIGELRKSGLAPAMKANLDVGTLTNFANITGGQTLGYVSLDTQMARGTVRPGSFTLYQALHKTRAFQVVDYWAYASDTGGPLPGAAFQGFSGVGSGTLATSAGKYSLQNITLKLAVNGRAITTALAAQNSFVDVTAQENINAALSVLESLNWASYWGNSTLFPNQFQGAYNQILAANIVDFQGWYNSQAASNGWSYAQALFNLIYQWSAQITSYNNFGRITHAFMSPTCAGSLQGQVTTLLNNVVNEITSHMGTPTPIVINGDLQGMRTRFGEIQFPIDLYITARDKPAQAIKNADGTTMATTTAPTPPASVTVAVSGGTVANTSWTAAYTAASGYYTYGVASCDQYMNESNLTYATPVSGVKAGQVSGNAYVLTITGPVAADATVFRVFRTGLGDQQSSNQNPASFRYIGSVAAAGSGAVTFNDLNTKIPGSEVIFLFDLDEQDNAIDYRYLLPLTKIELFAQNLFMPWAVTAIGGLRVRVPKFHGVINNYVGDNPDFNPLSTNVNAV